MHTEAYFFINIKSRSVHVEIAIASTGYVSSFYVGSMLALSLIFLFLACSIFIKFLNPAEVGERATYNIYASRHVSNYLVFCDSLVIGKGKMFSSS